MLFDTSVLTELHLKENENLQRELERANKLHMLEKAKMKGDLKKLQQQLVQEQHAKQQLLARIGVMENESMGNGGNVLDIGETVGSTNDIFSKTNRISRPNSHQVRYNAIFDILADLVAELKMLL